MKNLNKQPRDSPENTTETKTSGEQLKSEPIQELSDHWRSCSARFTCGKSLTQLISNCFDIVQEKEGEFLWISSLILEFIGSGLCEGYLPSDFSYKIAVLGDSGVGKSALILSLVTVFPNEWYSTMSNIYRTPVSIDGNVLLNVIDTIG